MNTQLRELVWSVFDLPAKARRTHPEVSLWESLGRFWCRTMHRDISWPMHSRYHCLTCSRVYHIDW